MQRASTLGLVAACENGNVRVADRRFIETGAALAQGLRQLATTLAQLQATARQVLMVALDSRVARMGESASPRHLREERKVVVERAKRGGHEIAVANAYWEAYYKWDASWWAALNSL